MPIAPDEVSRFGVVEVDRDHRVNGFQEKPKQTDLRSPFNPDKVDASMGIYIFNTDVLIPALLADAEDPELEARLRPQTFCPRWSTNIDVYAYNFVDENKKEALYWRDVGTLDAYYEANMDLVSVSPVFNLYDPTGRSAPTSASIRRPSSSSARPGRTGTAVDSIISAGVHHLRRHR